MHDLGDIRIKNRRRALDLLAKKRLPKHRPAAGRCRERTGINDPLGPIGSARGFHFPDLAYLPRSGKNRNAKVEPHLLGPAEHFNGLLVKFAGR